MHQQRQHRDFRAVNAAEQHAIGDHRTGVDVVGAPPVLQPRPRQPAEQKKSEAAGKGCEIDEQQRRPAVRIGDQAVAPGQARDDDHRERDQADGAVDEDGIGRGPPAVAAARHQPQPDRVAADRGGQRLVEEGSDHVEAHRLPGRQRRAALRADLAPSQHADEYLQERHGNRHADPAQAGNVDAGDELGKIDLAQREIQQRRRDHNLQRRKQDTAHLARAGFEKGVQKAMQFGALVWFSGRSGNSGAARCCGLPFGRDLPGSRG